MQDGDLVGKWLKCKPTFSHGYGTPEYWQIYSNNPEDLAEMKHEMFMEYGDDYRKPIYEIVDSPPREWLVRERRDTESRIASLLGKLNMIDECLRENNGI